MQGSEPILYIHHTGGKDELNTDRCRWMTEIKPQYIREYYGVPGQIMKGV